MSKNCSQIAFFLLNQILPFPSCMTLVNLLDLSVSYFPNLYNMMYNVHQFSSVAQSCPTLCDPMNHSTPGLPVHHQLPEFTQILVHRSVMASSHLILCHPFVLPPSIFPSIRVFSNELTPRMRWPKYWSFSFSISSSNEHPGQISFRMDWLDLLAVQGTLKSLLQHHSSKASIFRCSAFGAQSNSHIHTWPPEKPQPWLDGPLLAK